MFRMALINMPYADLSRPSIALTQLKAMASAALGERVETRIFYLNLDFAQRLGLETYSLISNSTEAMVCGLGDWFFRAAAFPSEPDDPREYFQRYASSPVVRRKELQALLKEKRQSLVPFLDELIDRHALDQYSLVGFTSMFQQNLACLAMARRLKERNRSITIIMGGANCETPMGQVLARNFEQIDFIFSGPALKNFPEFVQRLVEGEPERCHEIRGVLSRRKLERGSQREIGDELDINTDIPLDYSDYFTALKASLPAGSVQPSLSFETSRGCWWGERAHCTFCGLNGLSMKYRNMEPARALAQLERIFAYAPDVVRFEAVDNIMPREFITDVFPHVRAPKPMFYEVKADLDDAALAVLSRAGVKELQPGIEALSTSTLKLMKKGTTVFQNLRFLKGCLTHGITPLWNLLVGFPREEEEVYEKYASQLPLLFHLPPPNGAFPIRFDRFSPYFTQAQEYGLQLAPYDFYEMLYPLPPEELKDLAYFFYDENVSAPYIQGMVKWIFKLQEIISRWHERWSSESGAPKPELRFEQRDKAWIVLDTRAEEARRVDVGEQGARLLQHLAASASTVPRLAHDLGLPLAQIQETVALLHKHQLLFQEKDMLMGLLAEPAEGGETGLREVA